MKHEILDLQPDEAVALMKAALEQPDTDPVLAAAVDLPPGPELDAQVAEVLGVEPSGWEYTWGKNPAHMSPTFTGHEAATEAHRRDSDEFVTTPVVPVFKPYSTDAVASDEAREVAFKMGMGWAVEVPSPMGGFVCVLGDTDVLWEKAGPQRTTVNRFISAIDDEMEGGGSRGTTPQHARALAIVGAKT